LCLDGFLYNFTILPIRAFFAALRLVKVSIASLTTRRTSTTPDTPPQPSLTNIPPTHLHSLLRMLLIAIPSVVLLAATDASRMYHAVRGQDTIKLYVIFNALEVGRAETESGL
jgi:hypothetical protein